MIGPEADIAASSDSDILATAEAGIGAGSAGERGERKGLVCGGHGLGMNQGADKQYKAKQCEGAETGLQSDSLVASLTRRLS